MSPDDPVYVPSEFVEEVLGVLEAAFVPERVCDKVVVLLEAFEAELSRLRFRPLPATPEPGVWPWDGNRVMLFPGYFVCRWPIDEFHGMWWRHWRGGDGLVVIPTHYAAVSEPPSKGESR